MKKNYSKSLFIFHRDLRLEDNSGFIQAAEQSTHVIPCFIFDPKQVDTSNPYRSMNAIQFMIESLQDLENQIKQMNGKLYLFYGQTSEIIKKIIDSEKIDAIFCNRDYTPFSIKRDEAIEKECIESQIDFKQYGDALLHEPEEIKTLNGTPYAIFTAFYKHAIKHFTIKKPAKASSFTFYSKPIQDEQTPKIYTQCLPVENKNIAVSGGRAKALAILKNLGSFASYTKERDYPGLSATTYLSAHNKFGTVSIREVYWAITNELGNGHQLLRELYWRDFFTHVAYYSPFVFEHAFKTKYDKLSWSDDEKVFKAWCDGKTGFPIVDAGMRELNETGFMHNRVRMIVGSFLVKDLHINWQWGEQYFAQKLVDYDPAVNNGNWQWVASTGCDAQPYFRIFNPWLQQKKFDLECEYIKKWLPELKTLKPSIIHTWYKSDNLLNIDYPKPIVDHSKETQKTKALYKKVII